MYVLIRRCLHYDPLNMWHVYIHRRSQLCPGQSMLCRHKASAGSAGFNEWWRFYPCIGNAVSPPVIRDIGSAILDTLDLAATLTTPLELRE